MTETEKGFTAKERLRFRKLLEVANSTTYSGERDAAMSAATRLAASHRMSLREAAGMADAVDAPPPPPNQRPHRPSGFHADFGAANPENLGTWWQAPPRPAQQTHTYRTDNERAAAEKKRHVDAMAEAISRGLDAEERLKEQRIAKARATMYARPKKRGSWRARPEFVQVLLTETAMSAMEIAAAAGVTIYDVYREKLLMRRSIAA